ncbi:MAG: LemA family protein [Bdellovibrionales bacterium CG10_big_fil_rev_8_21_14_0_10_45_34]|nr:MAG: LemA family protein [Bdellovibrionales bacterium CG10_big_fil_rev_8_21_14_0_10_45_34]
MNHFWLIFIGVVLASFGGMMVNIYNGLVRLRSQVERAWANIEVVLKQRFDEIPQIVQVVEQYAGYESSVLKDLAQARTRYGSAGSVGQKIKAAQDMSIALSGVMAIGEAYPELKANENFKQLQQRVSALESQIADRRETYNDVIANFNARIEQFPDVFAAKFLNYQRQEMFKATEQERNTIPSLKMNLPGSRAAS